MATSYYMQPTRKQPRLMVIDFTHGRAAALASIYEGRQRLDMCAMHFEAWDTRKQMLNDIEYHRQQGTFGEVS